MLVTWLSEQTDSNGKATRIRKKARVLTRPRDAWDADVGSQVDGRSLNSQSSPALGYTFDDTSPIPQALWTHDECATESAAGQVPSATEFALDGEEALDAIAEPKLLSPCQVDEEPAAEFLALEACDIAIEVTEGTKFNRNLACFTLPSGVARRRFMARIDWGDGTSSTGAVLCKGAMYFVAGAHVYTRHGSYTAIVRIRDKDGPAGIAVSPIMVRDANMSAGRHSFRAWASREWTGAVAHFRDHNPFSQADHFTAEIHWGDGSASNGTIIANVDGGYDVLGTHTYAESGRFAVDVTVRSDGGATASAQSTARVNQAGVSLRGLMAFASAETHATVAVAAFRDPDRGAAPSHYSVVIDWADAHASTGWVESDGAGGFRVHATHRYERAGFFTARVTINGPGIESGIAMASIRVE